MTAGTGQGRTVEPAKPDAVRAIPVPALKAAAGMLSLLWLGTWALIILGDWDIGDPTASRIPFALTLALSVGLAVSAGQVWRIAVGANPQVTASDARYYIVGGALVLAAYVVAFGELFNDGRWRIAVVGALFAVASVLAIAQYRARKKQRNQIAAPIVTRAVHTPTGDRLIRVGMPREHERGWVTWWSVEGAPSGIVTYPAAGPDSLGSLQNALADAERAAAVI